MHSDSSFSFLNRPLPPRKYFRCWTGSEPPDEYTETGTVSNSAMTCHSEAVEWWAAITLTDGDPFHTMDVTVQEISESGELVGDPQTFTVHVDWEPSFYAEKKED